MERQMNVVFVDEGILSFHIETFNKSAVTTVLVYVKGSTDRY